MDPEEKVGQYNKVNNDLSEGYFPAGGFLCSCL